MRGATIAFLYTQLGFLLFFILYFSSVSLNATDDSSTTSPHGLAETCAVVNLVNRYNNNMSCVYYYTKYYYYYNIMHDVT